MSHNQTVNNVSTVYQRGKYYYVVYYDKNGVRRHWSSRKTDPGEAILAFERRQESIQKILFGEYAANFFLYKTCPHIRRRELEGRPLTFRYIMKSRRYVERFILADHRLCQTPLRDLTRKDVLDFRTRLVDRETKWIANRVVEVLKVIVSHAEYEQVIDTNPGAKVGRVHVEGKEKIAYDREQITALYRPEHFRNEEAYYFHLALANTGMRIGELDVLQWDQIDGGQLSIHRARKNWSTDEVGLPKWNKQRTILVPQVLQLILSRRPKDSEYVFHTNGVPHGYKWIRETYKEAVASAGLPDTSPHSTRHSFNTNLLPLVNPYLVQMWLGWSPRGVTPVQSGYTHFNPEHFMRMRPYINKLFGDAYVTLLRYGSSAS